MKTVQIKGTLIHKGDDRATVDFGTGEVTIEYNNCKGHGFTTGGMFIAVVTEAFANGWNIPFNED